MAKEKSPKRPDTPDHEAIIAIEYTLHMMLMLLCQENGEGAVEAMRGHVTNSFPAARSESGAAALEHADWLLARVQAGLRRASA